MISSLRLFVLGIRATHGPGLHSASAATTSGFPDGARRMAPWLAAVFVAAWVALSFQLDTAQWSDNFEQFAWAHSAEWGYHKHPPFSSWLLTAMIYVFGSHPWSAQVLAGLCIAATGWLTHRIARRLLGESAAVLALLFWGLQQPFSARATLFNHNTVMMLTVAATAWLVLRAVDSKRATRWWVLAGLSAGAASLTKYQAVVPLAGIVLALVWSGDWRRPGVSKGLSTAVAVALLCCAPHAWWMVQHSFSTLDYAGQHGVRLGALQRLASMTSFLAQQVRLLLPALVFAGVLIVRARRQRRAAGVPSGLAAFVDPTTTNRSAQRERGDAWLIGLIAFPLVVTVLMSPLFGLKLQNHWGYQALQFASLFFASRWGARLGDDGSGVKSRATAEATGRWMVTAIVVQAIFMAFVVATHGRTASMRIDAGYPAQELADAVRRDWQQASACPLRFVVGPTFEAGIVSIYNGGSAAVLEDGDWRKSPWIRPQDLAAAGAVYVNDDPALLPTVGVVDTGSLVVGQPAPMPARRVHWAIVPPLVCERLDH